MILIYVSHPYGGKQSNKMKCDFIIKELVKKYPTNVFISPLHALRRKYTEENYAEDMKACLEIESACDAVIMTGDWEASTGCLVERKFAKDMALPVFDTLEDFEYMENPIPVAIDDRKNAFYIRLLSHIDTAKGEVQQRLKDKRKERREGKA